MRDSRWCLREGGSSPRCVFTVPQMLREKKGLSSCVSTLAGIGGGRHRASGPVAVSGLMRPSAICGGGRRGGECRSLAVAGAPGGGGGVVSAVV